MWLLFKINSKRGLLTLSHRGSSINITCIREHSQRLLIITVNSTDMVNQLLLLSFTVSARMPNLPSSVWENFAVNDYVRSSKRKRTKYPKQLWMTQLTRYPSDTVFILCWGASYGNQVFNRLLVQISCYIIPTHASGTCSNDLQHTFS